MHMTIDIARRLRYRTRIEALVVLEGFYQLLALRTECQP